MQLEGAVPGDGGAEAAADAVGAVEADQAERDEDVGQVVEHVRCREGWRKRWRRAAGAEPTR